MTRGDTGPDVEKLVVGDRAAVDCVFECNPNLNVLEGNVGEIVG